MKDFHPQQLLSQFQLPLPGRAAQEKMWTGYRKYLTEEEIQALHPRLGAVMIQFYPSESGWNLLFIRRPEYEGVHSAQVAFPGGKMDESDPDLLYTAYRENREEVGVHEHQIQLIGALSRVYIPPSNFWVQPYVAYSETYLVFHPDPEEVSYLIEVSIEDLMDESSIRFEDLNMPYAQLKKVPGYQFQGHFVWGATAIILSELREMISRSIQAY